MVSCRFSLKPLHWMFGLSLSIDLRETSSRESCEARSPRLVLTSQLAARCGMVGWSKSERQRSMVTLVEDKGVDIWYMIYDYIYVYDIYINIYIFVCIHTIPYIPLHYIPYHTIRYYIPYHTPHTIPYHTIRYYIPYHTPHNIPYHTLHYINTIPYHTIQYIPYHTLHTIPYTT